MAYERHCKSRRTPHFALLALLPIQYAQRNFLCLVVMVKAHVRWYLHEQLACTHVKRSFSGTTSHVPKGPTISIVLDSSVVVIPRLFLA